MRCESGEEGNLLTDIAVSGGTPGQSEAVRAAGLRAVRWSALAEISSRAAQPLLVLILARMLSPADFGVVATAAVVVSLAQTLWDAGLARALVQVDRDRCEAANVVFWLNVLLAIFVYAFLFTGAPLVGAFFQSPGSAPILRVLGLQVIASSLGSVHQALLVRDLDFRRLLWPRLCNAVGPSAIAVVGAGLGFGPWSLVLGSVAGSTASTLLLWRQSNWRPARAFDSATAGALVRFGFWITAESFGTWFISFGDQFVIAKFLSLHDVGLYRVAANTSNLAFALLLSPVLPTVYPTFCRLRANRGELLETFRSASRLVLAMVLPAAAGALLVSDSAALLIFGPKWTGLAVPLALLSAAAGLSWTVGLNPDVYRAIGRPDINTKFMYGQMLLYVPAYLLAGSWGLKAFVLVKLGVCAVTIGLHVAVARRVLGKGAGYFGGARAIFVSAATMAAVLVGVRYLWPAPGGNLARSVFLMTQIATGLVTYGGCLYFLDRPFVWRLLKILRRVANAGSQQ